MLEFNSWYFVLLANFLILLVVLNVMLFQPLKRVLKEREGSVNDMLNEARSMMARKDEALKRINVEQTQAKASAKAAYEELRQKGLQSQKEMMTKSEAEALEMIEKARKELQADCQKARDALRGDVERLSQEIMNKLVKS